MGKKEPFIILDERTSADGSIWYINRYVDEVLEDKEVLEEWLKHDAINVKAGERILLKSRRKMIDVPTFFEAIHEGQTDILAELPQPYDPGNSSVPTQSLYNWEIDPPKPPAPFIVAAPDEFEVTRDPVETHKFVIPHRGYPDEVVRLKAGVARQQRLVAKWTLIMKKYEGGDSPRGSVVLQQEWDVGVVRAVDGDRVGVE
ncbi:MAG: hypothetical protein LQ343_005807 [Gyalolechia ehrenbergii]|nr:MAG: hypothetical protein LQ343_005807 [Gyalolechia ehrenbergii]